MFIKKVCATALFCFVSTVACVSAGSVPLSDQAQGLKKGLYQHYKGNLYEVVGISHHSETLEEFVNYRQLYGDYGYWVRPIGMFCETVTTESQEVVPRFRYMGEIGNLERSLK